MADKGRPKVEGGRRKKYQIHMYLPDEFHDKLVAEAESEFRHKNAQAAVIIMKYYRDKENK